MTQAITGTTLLALLVLLALAMLTEAASALQRTFYDASRQGRRPLGDRQPRHGHELR
jgi:hypothetical protein